MAVVVVAAAADAVADVVIVVVVLMRVEHGWMVAAGRVKPDRVVSLRKLRHDWSNIIFLKNYSNSGNNFTSKWSIFEQQEKEVIFETRSIQGCFSLVRRVLFRGFAFPLSLSLALACV